jgi:hypothetical protein
MFGRRRPILGAAVLVGASRSAARHEVEKQAQRDAERPMAVERAAEKKLLEQKENDRRTQLAIDEAIAKENRRIENADKVPTCSDPVTKGYGAAHQIELTPSNVNSGQGVCKEQVNNTQYCPNCGHGCRRGDRFCTKCGHKQPTD